MPPFTVAPAALHDSPLVDTYAISDSRTEQDRQDLITEHLPLVRFVAGKMRRQVEASTVIDFDDLVGFGTEGLIHAADTFDPAHGARFSTWAVMHIRTTILDALRTLDPLPRSVRQKNTVIERASHELAQRIGAWPTAAQVAAVIDTPLMDVRATMQTAARRSVSLDAVDDSGDQGRASWLSELADDDPEGNPEAVVDRVAERGALREAMAHLPEREGMLIRMYYQEGASMRAIGETLGVSESRVSQLHARALRLLREALVAETEGATELAA